MQPRLHEILENASVTASAPCRVDVGGTLDLALFHQTLRHVSPCTFNIAIDLRTTVTLNPYEPGWVKVTLKGFESARFPVKRSPFNHSLGLMFAVASYFNVEGVHIVIDSASPPRSALGGSSVAAVALIASLLYAQSQSTPSPRSRKNIALLAHAIEESAAAVPCGRQDQLAAAFGGVNAWYWQSSPSGFGYRRERLISKQQDLNNLEKHLLLAYCGRPHESKDINGQWVRQFLSGEHRSTWIEISRQTKKFIDAIASKNYIRAAAAMNAETALRRKLTPNVLDPLGNRLVELALDRSCGARFTGAGGGGCLWAIGAATDIDELKPLWMEALAGRKEAGLLDAHIDHTGLRTQRQPPDEMDASKRSRSAKRRLPPQKT